MLVDVAWWKAVACGLLLGNGEMRTSFPYFSVFFLLLSPPSCSFFSIRIFPLHSSSTSFLLFHFNPILLLILLFFLFLAVLKCHTALVASILSLSTSKNNLIRQVWKRFNARQNFRLWRLLFKGAQK